jgi:hypothetical protein
LSICSLMRSIFSLASILSHGRENATEPISPKLIGACLLVGTLVVPTDLSDLVTGVACTACDVIARQSPTRTPNRLLSWSFAN